ncbi:hypothetical protein L7F22_058373 [Adiantum nelumboides]|nr:hypothetical protein [Adiantum nelumboides]
MPAPLHNPPSDDKKLKGVLHASIDLYGKGNLEEDDMEQEDVLAIDEFAARTGGKRKGFGPQEAAIGKADAHERDIVLKQRAVRVKKLELAMVAVKDRVEEMKGR